MMDEELIKVLARRMCWANGLDPDTSLGGDEVNWLWLEYVEDAKLAIKVIEEYHAKVPE